MSSTPRRPNLPPSSSSRFSTPSKHTSTPSTPSPLAALPPFSSTSRSRLQALYSDISRQKTSNPTSYHANVEWWRNALEALVSCPPPSSPILGKKGGAGKGKLVLSADQRLVDSLRIEGVGKPLALGAVIPELITSKSLIPLSTFLTSTQSIYDPGWLPTRLAWYMVGKPLSWALERAGVIGEDGMITSLTQTLSGALTLGGSRGESDRKHMAWYGEYVVVGLVEKAAGEVEKIQEGKEGEGVAGALYTLQGFRKTFGCVAGLGHNEHQYEFEEEEMLSEQDALVLLKFLQRERKVVLMDNDVIKFISPFAAAEERTITVVDRGILELKTAVENMHRQIESIQRRMNELRAISLPPFHTSEFLFPFPPDALSLTPITIFRLTTKASTALRANQKPVALSALKSRKQLADILGKRLGSLEVLEGTLLSVEAAAGDVEIMKSYASSTTTLRTLLSHPSLQRDKIDETMDAMASANSDAKEVDDAIRIGGDIALGLNTSGEGIDESELEEELKMLVEEKMIEDRQRLREREGETEAVGKIGAKEEERETVGEEKVGEEKVPVFA
ncbi:hypothetical protein CCMSSC00406_0005070 [Pleurotus cornucopiae]|uniref:Uncharacterized protein n=1 Tax=Pleurotus cornucopiae TaxID=5321 RepID=A0ACB7J7X5_PLECO|nr:hypothetical protein CCMSSC00406_0005070 [Pleurotus cornucopiae]